MKNHSFPLLFLFCLLSILLLPIANAQTLTVSVCTDSSVGRFTTTDISGTLTLNGNPVDDGLVAIQVMSGTSSMLFLRTLNTGSDPQNLIAEIQNLFASDSEGNPRNNFATGGLSYFSITVVNNDVSAREIMVAVSVFDNLNCPLGYSRVKAIVPAESSSNAVLSVPIPKWANDGRATVFAAAFSDLPSAGGFPYCPEVSAVFTLDNTQGYVPPSTPVGSDGSYTLSYKVPPKLDLSCVYNVHVSSQHSGSLTYSSDFFDVFQPGDLDGNEHVDFNDITNFVNIYIAFYKYGYIIDSGADFDGNGRVDFDDITDFVNAYIAYYTY